VAVEAIPNFYLRLPKTRAFLRQDLSQEKKHELEKVEK
jgi:alpha-acetolactate decarboxylase